MLVRPLTQSDKILAVAVVRPSLLWFCRPISTPPPQVVAVLVGLIFRQISLGAKVSRFRLLSAVTPSKGMRNSGLKVKFACVTMLASRLSLSSEAPEVVPVKATVSTHVRPTVSANSGQI